MNLSSRDLRAFVALVEQKNFTRAAQRVHLSQPAFSALIRSLEDGSRRAPVRPHHAQRGAHGGGAHLRGGGAADAGGPRGPGGDFRDHAQQRRGRVAVAALPSLAAGWLPDLLLSDRRQHPGIELALFDTLSEQCLALLRAAGWTSPWLPRHPQRRPGGRAPVRGPLPPRLPRRPPARTAAFGSPARPRGPSLRAHVAQHECAAAPGGGTAPAAASQRIRGGAPGHGHRPRKSGLGYQPGPSAHAVPLPGSGRGGTAAGGQGDHPAHLCGATPARSPVGGGTGALGARARQRPFAAASQRAAQTDEGGLSVLKRRRPSHDGGKPGAGRDE